ncbi:TPA: hypothetical protein ACLA4W_001065, partial [Neisseria meningitidis]
RYWKMKEMKPVRYHIGDMPETSKQTASRHDDRTVGVDDDCFHDSFGQFLFGCSAEATRTAPISVKRSCLFT